MKTALIVGGAAVGLYLVWKYVAAAPTPVLQSTSPPVSFAASSMTPSGAATSVSGGQVHTPLLLQPVAPFSYDQGTTAGRVSTASAIAAGIASERGLQLTRSLTDVARADAAPEPAAPGPSSAITTTLGVLPVGGTLANGNQPSLGNLIRKQLWI